jgi:hypothetical protein
MVMVIFPAIPIGNDNERLSLNKVTLAPPSSLARISHERERCGLTSIACRVAL